MKISATPISFSTGTSSSGMMPPTMTRVSLEPGRPQAVQDLRDERQVSSGQKRKSNCVGVLLDDRLHDLLGRLVQPGVDDLEAGVAKRPGDHLRPAVVAVQTRLRHDDAIRALHRAPSVSAAPRSPDAPGQRRSCGYLRASTSTPMITIMAPGSTDHCRQASAIDASSVASDNP